jgi:hypothetical protein
MVVFDAATLLLLLRPDAGRPLDPATGTPVERVEERMAYLVQRLEKARSKILIPTPALSEVLVRAGAAGQGPRPWNGYNAPLRFASFRSIRLRPWRSLP